MIKKKTRKQKLELELADLKKKRVEIAIKIKDAKELGDLSENAEYHAAKEEQGFVESRIAQAEGLLKSATMVTPTTSTTKVSIGSKITVFGNDEKAEYEIVGMNEADPSSGKISAESPLGRAFLNAKKGDEIEVTVPAGKMKFVIREIH